MTTRESIIELGDHLTREGINAFSFYDISKALGIKNASIHYHFPTKTDLAVAIIERHEESVDKLIETTRQKDSLAKFKAFLSIYESTKAESRVCIVGSLATDLHTVDEKINDKLKLLANKILSWVTEILAEGKKNKTFAFEAEPRTKALMVVTNMLAALQLTRLTTKKDFITIRNEVLNSVLR